MPGFARRFRVIVALLESCQKLTAPAVLVIWYSVSVPLPTIVAEAYVGAESQPRVFVRENVPKVPVGAVTRIVTVTSTVLAIPTGCPRTCVAAWFIPMFHPARQSWSKVNVPARIEPKERGFDPVPVTLTV